MDARKVTSLALIVLVLARQVHGVKRVRINAGLRYPGGEVMLIAGEDFLIIYQDEEYDIGNISSLKLPEDLQTISAARGTGNPNRLFFYAPTFYHDKQWDKESSPVEYSPRWQKFLGNDGPDAVARRNGNIFVFKGCKVAVLIDINMEDLKQRNARKLGLPCSPDAAWASSDWSKIIVLKGDQIWIWGGGRDVDGPKAFSSMYTITSWELIPDGGEK